MLLILLSIQILFLQTVRCNQQKVADTLQSRVFGGSKKGKSKSRVQPVQGKSKSRVQPVQNGPAVQIAYLRAPASHSGSAVPAELNVNPTTASYTSQAGIANLAMLRVNNAPQQSSFYRPSEHESLSIPTIEPCQEVKCHLSIALVLDSSGSVGERDFMKQLSFARTFLEILAVKGAEAKLQVCTGIVRYSSEAQIMVNPCCANTLCSVLSQFHKIEYLSGGTNTNGALKLARQMLQATASYKKVALLITDGRSNTGGSPIQFATEMRKEDNIDIVALGVTNSVNARELLGISGYDSVTKIEDFDEFHGLADLLLAANAMGSEEEFDTTLEQICQADNSTFRETCEVVTDPEPPKSSCSNWGGWSNCAYKSGHRQICVQRRTCKQDPDLPEVSPEEKICKCGTPLTKPHVKPSTTVPKGSP